MLKLNEVKESCKITAYGFKAFVDYADTSNQQGADMIVSTLSPAVMAEMGVRTYYAPILPRGAVYNTSDDVLAADLMLNQVMVFAVEGLPYTRQLIVSRHTGTIDILQSMFPDAKLLSGNVSVEDIRDCFVIGTLPPHLIQYASAYKAVTVNDFDHSRDGDLSGQELLDRLHVCDAIYIEIK